MERIPLTGAHELAEQTREEKQLSARQRSVVRLVAEGRTNKEIGVILNISLKTVETHRAAAMRKLHLSALADLVRYAVRSGLIGPWCHKPCASALPFTVDVQSGLVRLKYANSPMQWVVLRPGDAENDTVLVGQVDNPTRMTDLVLRIRDWASKPTIPFTKSQLTSFSAGVCTQL
jgi:DNA-binding CsgD family transcriptional regulator